MSRCFSAGTENPSPGSGSIALLSGVLAACRRWQERKITPHTVRHTTACELVRAKVDINTIRAWLGHASIDTTNIYAEIDLEMKAQAMALCDESEPGPGRPWKDDKGLIAYLKSL